MGQLKILVLGDGLLGKELYSKLKCDFISRKKDNIDTENFTGWCDMLLSYDVIVNCIADTNTYSDDKESHWNTNYKFVYELLSFCNKHNKKLVHISTDYLYTFSNENASENDVPVHNNSWYGYTKLLSDGLIQLLSHNFLICRCTHKPYPFPYNGAWVDQKGNFDYVNIISDLIIQLINLNTTGVYNVGTETKTMFELASKTKNVDMLNSPSHIPKNTTMNIQKLKKTIKNDNN